MASVWGELKRRNVVRVAIAYVIASWLILQLSDVLISMLGLGESVGKLIFLILLVGFPLAEVRLCRAGRSRSRETSGWVTELS